MNKVLTVTTGFAWIAFSWATANAELIQVGPGGITTPLGSEDRIDLTLDTAAFTTAGLWDATSSTVGGGTIDGDLYYAFIARPLDREGGATYMPDPPGAVGGLTSPSGARGGGLISRDTTEVLGVGDNVAAHAYSIFGALTGNADLSNRIDVSPNLPMTFLVHIDFNASSNDAVTITGSTPYHTTEHKKTASGDASFDLFAFVSDASNNRWEFSNVAFATTAEEAIAAVPEPSTWLLLAMGAVGLAGFGARRRSAS